MISLERFNKQNHKYIYSIRRCSGIDCGYTVSGYAVSGCIGTVFYMMYPLKEVIKMYNAAAAQSTYLQNLLYEEETK